MWLQNIVFGTPTDELMVDPVVWFGYGGAFWLTLIIAMVSIFIGYIYLHTIIPSSSTDEVEKIDESVVDKESETESNKEEEVSETESVEEEVDDTNITVDSEINDSE